MFYLFSFLTMVMLTGSAGADTGKRKILLVAPGPADPDLIAQKKILDSDPAGIKDREIVISVVTPESDRKTYVSLRRESNGFLFILYGKDGGKKLSSSSPVTLEKLYGIIDRMPMRQEEMRERAKR